MDYELGVRHPGDIAHITVRENSIGTEFKVRRGVNFMVTLVGDPSKNNRQLVIGFVKLDNGVTLSLASVCYFSRERGNTLEHFRVPCCLATSSTDNYTVTDIGFL